MVCSADFVRSVRLTYAGPIASWKIIRPRYSYVTLMVYTMGGVCTMNHTCLSLIQITLLSTHTVFLSMSRIEAFSPIRSAFAEFTVPLDLPSSNSLQHLFSVRDSLHTYDFLTNVEDKYSAKPYRDGSWSHEHRKQSITLYEIAKVHETMTRAHFNNALAPESYMKRWIPNVRTVHWSIGWSLMASLENVVTHEMSIPSDTIGHISLGPPGLSRLAWSLVYLRQAQRMSSRDIAFLVNSAMA